MEGGHNGNRDGTLPLPDMNNSDSRISQALAGMNKPGNPGPSTSLHRRRLSASPHHASDNDSRYESLHELRSDDDGDESDYEHRRQEQIEENERLMAEIMAGTKDLSASWTTGSHKAKKRRFRNLPKVDRDGYIVKPAPGQRVRMACVEIQTSRSVRRAIDNGHYTDCTNWSAGEDRRWRYGFGDFVSQEGDTILEDGVASNFRWRDAGIQSSVAPESAPDQAEIVTVAQSPDTELPSVRCHQCRRRTDKPTMECRNLDPECHRHFCIVCCRRYPSLEFDETSRSFICPFCTGTCNCSVCLRKRGLEHLIPVQGQTLDQLLKLPTAKTPTYDRSPQLTVEWEEWLEDQKRSALGLPPRKRRRKHRSTQDDAKTHFKRKRGRPRNAPNGGGVGGGSEGTAKAMRRVSGGKDMELTTPGKSKGKAVGGKGKRWAKVVARRPASSPGLESPGSSAPSDSRILLRFKVPSQQREKEVDSDGDTLGSITDNSSGSPCRSRFSSHSPDTGADLLMESMNDKNVRDTSINDYLARIAPGAASSPASISHPALLAGPYEAVHGTFDTPLSDSVLFDVTSTILDRNGYYTPPSESPVLKALPDITMASSTEGIPPLAISTHHNDPTLAPCPPPPANASDLTSPSRGLATHLGISTSSSRILDFNLRSEHPPPKWQPREPSHAEEAPPPYPPPRTAMFIPVDSPPRQRRRPPPAANIVRVPKYMRDKE